MHTRFFAPMVALATLFTSAHAASTKPSDHYMDLYGSELADPPKPASSTAEAETESRDADASMWKARIAGGFGISQLVSTDTPTRASEVTESAFQFNLSATGERNLVGQLYGESGLGLSAQFVSMGPATGTNFTVRYIDVPLIARYYFTEQLSFGAGFSLVAPLDSAVGLSENRRLTAPDAGIIASARWSVPMSVQLTQTAKMNWLIEGNFMRGMMHLGDAGAHPNHLRNFGILAGMAAQF